MSQNESIRKLNGLKTLRSISLKKIYKYILWKDI